jgi:pyruvate ferredoxin oxidoreductase gamma subunit/2-oxoisovalerate ferredoxin oxidoreductase gamma subunit
MIELRFHGRGGQGTVVASILMAKAFFNAGYYVQTFPLFGVERRGASVEAYLRLAPDKIRVRTNVYTPDHVMVQDVRLLSLVPVTAGLKPGGWVLLNAREAPESSAAFKGFRPAWVDATRIAVENGLGTATHPIINTAMIGAFARVLEIPPLNALEGAIAEEIQVRPEANLAAARQAYDWVRPLAGHPVGPQG